MAKEIYERLCTKFEEQVALDQVYDLREVQRMVEKWRDRPEDLKLADGLFDWHKMKDYELPWEASQYLLDMWFRYQEEFGLGEHMGVHMRGVISPAMMVRSPTVRQVKWWWRIHLAHPDISPIDVAYIAQRYVGREIAAVVMGEEPEMSDLDAWLAYRGWSEWESLGSSNRHDIYLKAVKEGKIPPLKSTYDAQRQAAEVYPKSGLYD